MGISFIFADKHILGKWSIKTYCESVQQFSFVPILFECNELIHYICKPDKEGLAHDAAPDNPQSF